MSKKIRVLFCGRKQACRVFNLYYVSEQSSQRIWRLGSLSRVTALWKLEGADIANNDFVLIDPVWLDNALKYRQLVLANREAEFFQIISGKCLGLEEAIKKKIAKKEDLPQALLKSIIHHIVGLAFESQKTK